MCLPLFARFTAANLQDDHIRTTAPNELGKHRKLEKDKNDFSYLTKEIENEDFFLSLNEKKILENDDVTYMYLMTQKLFR